MKAADLMLSDLKTKRSLDELTRLALLNEYDFKILFKKVTGQSRHAFLVKKRIAHAKQLLTTTSLKITEVADACGYNAEYFAILFKNKTGYSPTMFRRRFADIPCSPDWMIISEKNDPHSLKKLHIFGATIEDLINIGRFCEKQRILPSGKRRG